MSSPESQILRSGRLEDCIGVIGPDGPAPGIWNICSHAEMRSFLGLVMGLGSALHELLHHSPLTSHPNSLNFHLSANASRAHGCLQPTSLVPKTHCSQGKVGCHVPHEDSPSPAIPAAQVSATCHNHSLETHAHP